MNSSSRRSNSTDDKKEWVKSLARFSIPDARKSLWQLANSLIPYLALWGLMIYSMHISYWLVLALAVPAAGFMVRLFIIFHDCGHGAFFKSARANTVVGYITGILTLTPYHQWRYQHALHHGTAGNLDRRGLGDVWTMTVEEYRNASRWTRFTYRIYRHPFFMLVFGPLFMFIIVNRLPNRNQKRREKLSVLYTNLALLAVIIAFSLAFGLKTFLLIQLPVLLMAGSAGIWLFYVQHQFEDVYWERGDRWDFVAAAIEGSSFYKLPKLLQWFSGNIGFHHIHHLNSRIPNYRLAECQNEVEVFQQVKPITLKTSLASLRYRLYDERTKRLVDFRALKQTQPNRRRSAMGQVVSPTL